MPILPIAQRAPNMNGGPNANRNPIDLAGLKSSSQMTVTKLPRTANANGGPIQPTQSRQQAPPPPQGQMVTLNRQPTQNQMLPASQLQKLNEVTITKPNRKASFCSFSIFCIMKITFFFNSCSFLNAF